MSLQSRVPMSQYECKLVIIVHDFYDDIKQDKTDHSYL